jgi:chemotaxis protein MotB
VRLVARKKVEEKHANSERWLLTYSDMITLLLVFFIVLYSMSKSDVAKFKEMASALSRAFNSPVLQGADTTSVNGQGGPVGGNGLMDDFMSIRTDVMSLAQAMGVQNEVRVTVVKEGITISLSGNLLFDSGRADLRSESTKMLDKVAERLKLLSNEVRIEGHTDNIPIDSDQYPTNWELSTSRATAVTRYLAEANQIEPKRLSAQGYGEYRPVADNSTRDGRALNRRVDIVIIYPDQSSTPTSGLDATSMTDSSSP